MNTAITILRLHSTRLTAVMIILAIFSFARLPGPTRAERTALASRFHFARLQLPELGAGLSARDRDVHPDFSRISAWISSVGASVALNDLDGDGLPNDAVYVDVRNDQVIVAPAPGAHARYPAFALNHNLPYDSDAMAPMGCLPGDFNEDGLIDILVYYWGRTPVIHLRKDSTPAGSSAPSAALYRPVELLASGDRWYTNAATQADVDGDGHIDIIIGNYFPDGARVLDSRATGDERMQGSMSNALDGGQSRIFLWAGGSRGAEPSVSFKEAAGALDDGVARGWTLAVGAADLNGDLLPEIYFANDFGPDRLLLNNSRPGEPRFSLLRGVRNLSTPKSKVLGYDSFKGMGVDFGDLNGDGLLDIYVSNIASEYALQESHFVFLSTGELSLMKEGIAPYKDESETLGLSRSAWAWDARLADFDNDGTLEALQAVGFMKGSVSRWPELHEIAMGNDQLLHNPKSWHRFKVGDDLDGRKHNPFFVRARDGRYYDLAEEIGLAQSHVSRGIAIADVDRDGRLDFAVSNQWEPSFFYRNQGQGAGAFLGLRLLLPTREGGFFTIEEFAGAAKSSLEGRPAIGASATVYLPDGRKLVAQVDGGNGHSGKRSPDLHFGLGELSPASPLRVDLLWRDPTGRAHEETIRLKPGWHTVVLGLRSE